MFDIHVRNENQDERLSHDDGLLLVGRAPEGDGRHLLVKDLRVSRKQLRVAPREGGRVLVENLGKDVRLDDGSLLKRGAVRQVPLPFSLRVGHTTIDFGGEAVELSTVAPPVSVTTAKSRQTPAQSLSKLASLGESPDPEVLTHWFETLLTVQASAASSDAFHEQTARALVDLVGLDRGLVLRLEGEEWRVVAGHSADGQSSDKFSRTVLREVLSGRRTFYDSPTGEDLAQSLMSLECVVASPIFSPEGDVAGVVYGSRDLRSSQGQGVISRLEAQVVQLLAGAVSAGLARVEQEAEAARLRVQFEQFFSPALAAELEKNPRLLDATEREITVLFSDVRGFSSIAERLGARRTYELVADLLDRLTARVLEHGGVVVDYYGDGLEAMWNAPTDQPDHASLACRAAIAMQEEMPALDETWRAHVGAPLQVGIGIHSGRALIGNAGSSRRLKYGPRGHVVNLASRVESATKQLGAPILLTGSVAERLGEDLPTLRLGGARLAGVDEIVQLYRLGVGGAAPGGLAAARLHALALEHHEAGRFEEAVACTEGSEPNAALRLLLESAKKGRSVDGAAFDLSRRK